MQIGTINREGAVICLFSYVTLKNTKKDYESEKKKEI